MPIRQSPIKAQLVLVCLGLVIAATACTGDADPAPTTSPPASPAVTAAAVPTRGPASPAGTEASPAGTGTLPATPAGEPSAPDATATAATSTPAPPFDPARIEVRFEELVRGLDALTLVTHAGDGTGDLYAVEQRGTIVRVGRDARVDERPFLDLRDRVAAGGERGLLGLAFHPDYAGNQLLYVNYTDSAGDTVVSELRSDGSVADPASERVLLQIDQPFGNHNGGMLAFGPDGYLYVSTGDGGGAGDPQGAGQDLSSLLGTILRIDVDSGDPYAVPSDNPFLEVEGARPEIWAAGLRNPWRFTFDRSTGDMFIGDVGQASWEEVNAQPAGVGGRNYGWSVMEGPDCFGAEGCDTAGLTMPIAAYRRAEGNCAVTGGHVYRGSAQPLLAGAYLFSDYCSGTVWALDAARAVANGEAPMTEVGRSGIAPAAFGEDERGELYLAGHGGEVLRLVAVER